MKHIKLFEEFRGDIWKNVKEFPLISHEYDYKGIVFSGSDQLLTLIDYFDKKGYYTRTVHPKDLTRKDMIERAEKTPNTIYFWNDKEKTAYYTDWSITQIEADLKKNRLIKFEDYFEPNEKFKGYVSGRNFGI